VLVGGCVLAFFAAAVNADFMLRFGVSVSHLTGDLSRVSVESVRAGSHWSTEASVLMWSILGFIGGAAVAGFFIHHPTLDLRRPYGRSVIGIGLLLLVAEQAMPFSLNVACFLAAAACGLQNALATRFRGLVLRTTHITGLLTDLGQNFGMKLRGHEIERWKIGTPLAIGAAFLAGAATGAHARLAHDLPVATVCGIAYIVGGIGWSVWKRIGRPGAA
jgi:uncharacterized membrane protein YoaK (UPF0700 family)